MNQLKRIMRLSRMLYLSEIATKLHAAGLSPSGRGGKEFKNQVPSDTLLRDMGTFKANRTEPGNFPYLYSGW